MGRPTRAGLIDIMSFFWVPMRLFMAYGMQLYPMSPDERVSLLQNLAFCNLAGHIAVHIFLAPMYQIKHPPVLVKEFTDTVVLLVFFFLAIIRFTMVVTKREQVKQIIEMMKRYFPETIEDQKMYGVRIYYEELIRVLKIFTICLSVSCALYCVDPYVTLLVDHLKGRPVSFEYQLPFPLWYPFAVNNPFRFALVYCSQVYGSASCGIGFFCPEVLLIGFTMLINMNFKHLANRIRNLKPSNAEDDIRNLNKLLSYHQDMLFSVDIVNEIFSFSLLINFFAAGALLCLAAVNVIAGSSFYDYIRHTTFLLVALADMYYVCKHADNLMTLSTDISDAFAEHPWYNGSIYYQRMLVFPIARAQRPAALYAYKFFVVSMESFQSLLTSSYQFFTLIKARFDEE